MSQYSFPVEAINLTIELKSLSIEIKSLTIESYRSVCLALTSTYGTFTLKLLVSFMKLLNIQT